MRAWEGFLAQQEKELGAETVNKWLRPLKIVRFDACNLYLEASDSFKAIWFEEHMRHKVHVQLFNNSHKQIKVHLSVSSEKTKEEKPEKKNLALSSGFQIRFDDVLPSANFETFVTCPENLLAYKLLNESCKSLNPADSPLLFNPIYLFGRQGTGKTHLLMAMANALKTAGQKTIYVRAETFTEHVVAAIRSGEMQQFRKSYRNIDALIIDDIEVFSKKSATQEELFHAFNTLHTAGKQILLSGSCPPQELKLIEPRLVSRFEWGIVIPLQTPGKESLKEILLKKAQSHQLLLSEAVIEFLIATFEKNAKSLIRAFEALLLRTHLRSQSASEALTLTMAKQLLSDLVQEEEKAVLTPAKIIRTVAEFYGISSDDLLSKSQSRDCALPRQIAMHLCRKQLNLPYMKIGDIFSRDHSTVMTSIRQVQKNIESKNIELTVSVNGIIKKLDS